MFSHFRLDALLAGFISIFFIFLANMAIIITALSLLPDHVPADWLHLSLKIITIISLALPPYVAARAAPGQALLHSLTIGFIQSLLMIAMMTQTFSWQGTLQNDVISRLPLIIGSLLFLSIIAGMLARWMNQKNKS